MADFSVVLVGNGGRRSQRDAALESARIKAHAARIAHSRRRAAKVAIKGPGKISAPLQCPHGDLSQCVECSKPKVHRGWRRDPFASHAGHKVPTAVIAAMDYCMYPSAANNNAN
jgi:hypothetical protein